MKVTKLYWVMNIMQIIQGVEAELHTFLTLAPDGSEWAPEPLCTRLLGNRKILWITFYALFSQVSYRYDKTASAVNIQKQVTYCMSKPKKPTVHS
jgi:hypothetical protein